MLTANKQTLPMYPSLLPLRMALIVAESMTPPRPVRVDANERRALQLIDWMRAEYKKPLLLSQLQDVPNPQGLHISLYEMEGIHAR